MPNIGMNASELRLKAMLVAASSCVPMRPIKTTNSMNAATSTKFCIIRSTPLNSRTTLPSRSSAVAEK